jgi:hypothetical protein
MASGAYPRAAPPPPACGAVCGAIAPVVVVVRSPAVDGVADNPGGAPRREGGGRAGARRGGHRRAARAAQHDIELGSFQLGSCRLQSSPSQRTSTYTDTPQLYLYLLGSIYVISLVSLSLSLYLSIYNLSLWLQNLFFRCAAASSYNG